MNFPSLLLNAAVVFGMAAGAVSATVNFTAPALTITQCAAAPIIDGTLDDPCWRDAARVALEQKYPPQAQGTTGLETSVYLTYDAEKLYIAFKCTESDLTHVKESETRRDGEVWSDDCVEVFLDTKIQNRSYYHFIVNARGTQADAINKDASWDGDWQARASKGKDFWAVEMAIPFKILRFGELPWGLNLTRTRQWPATEFRSWSPVEKGFHEPEHFGTLEGLDVPFYASLKITEEGSPEARIGPGNVMKLGLKNQGSGERNLSLDLTVSGPKGANQTYRSDSLKLAPKAADVIKITFPLNDSGPYSLRGNLRDTGEKRTVYTFVKYCLVPDLLDLQVPASCFYRDEDTIRYTVSINGTGELWKNNALILRIKDSQGKIRTESRTKASEPVNYLHSDISRLELGDYVLVAELWREGKFLARVEYIFKKIPGFWE